MQMNPNHQLLSSVMEILKMLAESGAEIYRVEESANKIFSAYGIKNIDVYATTSNIIVSLETASGEIKTHTRRIKNISTDVEKIHQLNDVVRKIADQTPSVSEIQAMISCLLETPSYSSRLIIFFYGIIAGAFYFFFGGRNLFEGFFSISVGLVSGVIATLFQKARFNKIFEKFACSFVASFLILLLYQFHLVSNSNFLVIANIMTLIPGIGLTNALRDLFVGDSISGVLRLVESALLAVAIAGGYLINQIVLGGMIR
jgi:uncharacterized membrane protein YjjP (DUF1212 family)